MKLEKYKPENIRVKSSKTSRGEYEVNKYREEGQKRRRAVKKKVQDWWDAFSDAFEGD